MPIRFNELALEWPHLPPAIPLPIDLADEPVTSMELATERPLAASRDEYLIDYSHSEMARHRGFSGTMNWRDAGEGHGRSAITMPPAD